MIESILMFICYNTSFKAKIVTNEKVLRLTVLDY